MRDRVPKNQGRVRLTPVPGQDNLYDLVRADDPITEGTPLCKATLLPDSVCDVLGIDRETSTPADALLAIPAVLGKALLRITAKHADGSAYTGLQINGITGVDAARCVTDDAGKLMVYVSEGSYTLSSAEAAKYIDTTTAAVSVSIKAGEIKDVTIQETAKTTKRLEIKTTQNIMFSRNVTSVDVFCVGGGGGGGGATDSSFVCASGGGGGYAKTGLNIKPEADKFYTAAVGSGGSGGGGGIGELGGTGGTSSLLGVSAQGGNPGGYAKPGGSGGSGGGDSGAEDSESTTSPGNGGADGGNGTAGWNRNGGGVGQGTTTRAFGEAAGALYSGGGGGGGWTAGAGGVGGGGAGGAWQKAALGGSSAAFSGGANTGGGGGGACHGNRGASGGSGIIIIRWRTKT